MAASVEDQTSRPLLAEEEEEEDDFSVSDSDDEDADETSPIPNSNPNLNPNPNPNPNRRFAGGLFQRLWTDDDEIVILEGFLDFVTERGTTHANYQHDTGPFYDRIKNRIQLEFNKNQLIEKLRRLKKKYRTIAARISSSGDDSAFRSPHERRIYDIARNIWSSSAFKRPRNSRGGGCNGVRRKRMRMDDGHDRTVPAMPPIVEEAPVPVPVPLVSSVVEETVRCCLSPLFKELVRYGTDNVGGFDGFCLDWTKFSGDERWREQKILELEVFLKRAELVEEEIRSRLEELRSMETVRPAMPGS